MSLIDPLHPASSVLCKLGSIIVHMQEYQSLGGHRFDVLALEALLEDAEVLEWLRAMNALGLVPVRR